MPDRVSAIEVVEVSKGAIMAKPTTGNRAPPVRIRPYSDKLGFHGRDVVPPEPTDLRIMDFSLWRFFHAAKKTSYLQALVPSDVTRAAATMADEFWEHFFWDRRIRLVPGAAEERKDADRTHLAARVGEGLGHLLMADRFEFKYWDHLPSLFERLTSKHFGAHPEQVRKARAARKRKKRSREPDFVFEKRNEVALAECKGHFVRRDASPVQVIEPLRDALDQLAGWPRFLSPRPKRSFAINAHVVEKGYDEEHEPSFIAFVDPEDDDEPFEELAPLPLGDAVRRGNYAAWLLAMGFVEAAQALRWNEPGPGEAVDLGIYSVGNREIAAVRFPTEVWIADGRLAVLLRLGWRPSAMAVGMEIGALQRVIPALRGEALEDDPEEHDIAALEGGSLFADGTWIGMLDGMSPVRTESFTI